MTPNYARRRRVAATLAALTVGSGIVEANGGPEQIAHNIKTLPQHVEWVFSDRSSTDSK
jgi:hypothetical protein